MPTCLAPWMAATGIAACHSRYPWRDVVAESHRALSRVRDGGRFLSLSYITPTLLRGYLTCMGTMAGKGGVDVQLPETVAQSLH